ncbi:ribonuclease E inhibitor RraB [Rhizobium ruizarguesonis]|uniref:ribonuclease E inhibitor RraB n=1 Tax=Rhizobium ruizarguesonis TaxID=2081791 RepID=UPI0010300673|nr:ribonuclease E inhibitor RraB [Rhizobium ruizarguesonis]TAT70004.1 ribonuclease E inhibitor RraB [Rhizobium ruizarguesonis]
MPRVLRLYTQDTSVPLIERNAQLLASLEEEWNELGPLRRIEFNAEFHGRDWDETLLPARDYAQNFAAFAAGQGCQCDLSQAEHGQTWYVTASKRMEATATAITELQERLAQFAESHDRGSLTGWSYPRKKWVEFQPNRSNKGAADARAAVLFGSDMVKDPLRSPSMRWSSIGKLNSGPVTAFQLIPSEFLQRARELPPKDAQPTASAFAQWVYSLYSNANGSDEDRERGKEAEEDIWKRRSVSASCTDNRFLRSSGSPWILMHNGLHLPRKQHSDFFEVPHLLVKGEPLRASPDLVYVNKREAEILIVEIKYSHLPIPKNLWPNVWAQLWCYSQIDVATAATKVRVVGEVWSEMWSKGYGQGRRRTEGKKLVCLRASVRRDPRAQVFHQFFRALFQIYSGEES